MGCVCAFPGGVFVSHPLTTLPILSCQLPSEAARGDLFLYLCRFWKRAGFVPVYLRQTPVSEAEEGCGFAVTVGDRSVLIRAVVPLAVL